MTLDVARKRSQAPVRALSPVEEAALRAVRDGDADPGTHAAYLATVNDVRDRHLWILCDCRPGEAKRPFIVPRRISRDRIVLASLPDPLVQHADDCVFARRPDAIVTEFEDDLNPFVGRRESPLRPPEGACSVWEFKRLSTKRVRTVSGSLRMLMEAAGLNTLEGAERLASQSEWLAEIGRAAEEFYFGSKFRVSEFLFTDPEDWSTGKVAEALDQAKWPKGERPCAFLCWPARELLDREIVGADPRKSRVKVESPVVSPKIGGNRVQGPYLFLGAVGWSEDRQAWECLMAGAQPIVAFECPLPVDSHQERRAFGTLRHGVRELANDRKLREGLGGSVKLELHKQLSFWKVDGGSCLPDFVLIATRPGREGHSPGGTGHPRNQIRYIVEVMGFDRPKYEQGKLEAHALMRKVGRVFRMDAAQFDSRHNGLRHQREKIIRDIGNDLLYRWGPD